MTATPPRRTRRHGAAVRRRRDLLIVPAIAGLYATTAACGGFWDQPVDKGAPEDYLAAPVTTTAPTTTPGAITPPPVAVGDATTPSAPAVHDEGVYAAVCADPATQIRVADEECEGADPEFTEHETFQYYTGSDGEPGLFYWYYFDAAAGRVAPAIGQPAAGGTFITPRPAPGRPAVFIFRQGSVPTTGGTVSSRTGDVVQRGGFGVTPGNTGDSKSGSKAGTSAAS